MSDFTYTTDDGMFTISSELLKDPKFRAALETSMNAVDRDQALTDIWEMIDAEFDNLNVQSFELEWCSEYDDEGGYFWALGYSTLLGPDDEPIEDDEAHEAFRDNLYEIDMTRDTVPDGVYRRT